MATPVDTIRLCEERDTTAKGSRPNREILQWGVFLPQASTRLTSRVPLTLHYHTIRTICIHSQGFVDEMPYYHYIHTGKVYNVGSPSSPPNINDSMLPSQNPRV
jgi:hypothetical protein